MTENDEDSSAGRFDISSKFWRVFLVVATVFLIFAGPTYVSYALFDILKVGYIVSVVFGFVLFIIGIVLMVFLVRKKIIV
jgi:uncharacterized membrane protein HdeD (DUF308 family)